MGEDAAWRSALSSAGTPRTPGSAGTPRTPGSAGTPRTPGSAAVSCMPYCCRWGLRAPHRRCLGGLPTRLRSFSGQQGCTASSKKCLLLQCCNTARGASAARRPSLHGRSWPRSRPSVRISLQHGPRVCLNKQCGSDLLACSSHVVAAAPTIRSLAGSPLAGFVWNFPRRVVTIESHRASD